MGEEGAIQLLTRVQELVERGWCQGVDAIDSGGSAVKPWDPSAEAWSLLGALVCSWDELTEDGITFADLTIALDAIATFVPDSSLATWNDDTRRSQEDVLTMLRAARRELRRMGVALAVSLN